MSRGGEKGLSAAYGLACMLLGTRSAELLNDMMMLDHQIVLRMMEAMQPGVMKEMKRAIY